MKRHRSTDAGHDGSESYGVCQTCEAEARADALDVEALAKAWHMTVGHKPGCDGDIHAQGIRVHRADATDIARTYRAILAERQP